MLLYLSIFTLLISMVVLYYNWNTNRNTIYLSFVFVLTSLFGISHYLVASGDSRFWLAVFYNHFAPIMFLIGPFLYFYIRNTLTNNYSLSKMDLWHFVPSLIATVGSLPYVFQSFDEKLAIADKIIQNKDAIKAIEVNLFYTMEESFVFRTGIAFVYLLRCAYLLWKLYPSENKDKNPGKSQILLTYRWLIILITNLLFIFTSFILFAINAIGSDLGATLEEGQVLYVISGIAYSSMSFSLILFPEILYGIPRRNETTIQKNKKVKNKIALEEDPFFNMYNEIIKVLNEEKPFLNPDFSISDLALRLKAPQNHISYCITYLMETKFSKLKSELRINYALELLKQGSNSVLTIEAIGKQSGFKTRSNFYAAFKEETGFTPTEYINNKFKDNN
jgi:AraC-like DNA-binding protein